MSAPRAAIAVAAPKADASRVASIRNSLNLTDASAVEAFGERARREVTAGVDRLAAEVRSRDITDAIEILKHAQGLIDALDPSSLTPGGGLAALVNGREARLERFRRQFESASKQLEGLNGDLMERAERLDRKAGSLNHLHDQAKTFILELDAYLEAARLRIGELSHLDAASAPKADRQQLDGAERLQKRLAELETVRRAAVEQLPLVRIVQNVDGPLHGVMEAAVNAVKAWRSDWSERLGMHLGRNVRVRPDEVGLAQSKAALTSAMQRAVADLGEAKGRRSEAEEQMDVAARTARKPS